MNIYNKLFAPVIFVIGLGICFQLSAGNFEEPVNGTDEQKLAAYPDLSSVEGRDEALSLLLGHHPRVGSGSTLQQLPPPELREVAQKVKESHVAKGKRIYLELLEFKGTQVITTKFSLRLTNDEETFGDLTERLRKIFKIPESAPINYRYLTYTALDSHWADRNAKILDILSPDRDLAIGVWVAYK